MPEIARFYWCRVLVALVGFATPLSAQPDEPPRLVLMVCVDQLRPDLLSRYESVFVGGLARLMNEGLRFDNAFHDHAVTNTAPGHATLATGVVPARHGIVDNSWYEWRDGEPERIYSVRDIDSAIVGFPDVAGVSPHRLLLDGLADWVHRSDPRSQVVSLGGKDRSAVVLGGRGQAHVYWFSTDAGRFVTSTWYRTADPEWLQRFHREELPRYAAQSTWECSVPPEARALARADTTDYEASSDDSYYPHAFDDDDGEHSKDFWRWWSRTPYPDQTIVALATEAVRALDLGADSAPDLLALALSQTDIIGHRYGPLSLEQLDNLLHLDRALGSLFDFLDVQLGSDAYVVGFSSDHGVLTIPEQLMAQGKPARRVPRDEVEEIFDSAKRIGSSSDAEWERCRRIAEHARALDFIADAMPHSVLASSAPADSFVDLYRNSYHPERIFSAPMRSRKQRVPLGIYGVAARLEPATVIGGSRAVHGSPYAYDRHVPMIFMGHHVRSGVTLQRVRTVDFAPTLAQLAGIQIPENLDGTPLDVSRNPR
ncbi:MAG: alkaline phosphatase family protein [Candidatus Latescibacterota bacterium]|nr:MAG: alkaline phosphatase family protein [Candidatus Latescibacterota bacterium]